MPREAMNLEIILCAVDSPLATAWRVHCGHLPGVRVHAGSILDISCDALVSPANSFGFMDGGIDRLYVEHFGAQLEHRVRRAIADRHHGELLVGDADLVATGDDRIPRLIVAPTMRVPMRLIDSVNPYLAARAALAHIRQGTAPIRSVAFPGLGTGVGQVGAHTCARQMCRAIEHVVLGQWTSPRTWAEASEQHQLLYTDRPRRLQ